MARDIIYVRCGERKNSSFIYFGRLNVCVFIFCSRGEELNLVNGKLGGIKKGNATS